jgi:catechol 2,3-dioxygenase
MHNDTASTAVAAPTLPDALALGPVHLVVTGLDRSVAWYTTALGLRVVEQGLHTVAMGDGTTAVLVLHEDAAARPARRESGLYHVALLYPSREELARAALRLAAARVGIQGASDHGTHEALYLADPDGNGLELAADRPREVWPTPEEEFSGGGPRPLDFTSLLATVEGETPPAHVGPGLRTGHVHLHVGSIAEGLAFYRDVLGLQVWGELPSAAFVSAGGYHHHLAFNVWRGEGIGPQPPHTVGLHHWTIELPTPQDVAAVRARMVAAEVSVDDADSVGFTVRDPWQIPLRVTVASRLA